MWQNTCFLEASECSRKSAESLLIILLIQGFLPLELSLSPCVPGSGAQDAQYSTGSEKLLIIINCISKHAIEMPEEA